MGEEKIVPENITSYSSMRHISQDKSQERWLTNHKMTPPLVSYWVNSFLCLKQAAFSQKSYNLQLQEMFTYLVAGLLHKDRDLGECSRGYGPEEQGWVLFSRRKWACWLPELLLQTSKEVLRK